VARLLGVGFELARVEGSGWLVAVVSGFRVVDNGPSPISAGHHFASESFQPSSNRQIRGGPKIKDKARLSLRCIRSGHDSVVRLNRPTATEKLDLHSCEATLRSRLENVGTLPGGLDRRPSGAGALNHRNCETRDNSVDICLLYRFNPRYNKCRCGGYRLPDYSLPAYYACGDVGSGTGK
jgi:hypothetical protein